MNEDFSKTLTNYDNVITQANALKALITKYGSPGDPNAVALRNSGNVDVNDFKRGLGQKFSYWSHGLLNLGQDDQHLTDLQNAYDNLKKATDAQMAQQMIRKDIIGAAHTGQALPQSQTEGILGLGKLTDPHLVDQLTSFANNQSDRLHNAIQQGISNHWRVDPDIAQRNSIAHVGDAAPGASVASPIKIQNQADIEKLPGGSIYQAPSGSIRQKPFAPK